MAGYGQVASEYWPAAAIGALLVLALVAWTVVALLRIRRHRRHSAGDQPVVEASVVRERLAGRIDTATYRSRMHDLASGRRP